MRTRILILISAILLSITFCFGQDGLSEAMCLNTLKTWNNAINNRNETELANVYSGVVNYYQTCLTNNQVRESHSRFFKKNACFHQYYDNITFDFINGCQAQVRFDKHVQTVKDGPYTTYVSYLHMTLNFDDDGALIIGESDTTTDKNLEKRKGGRKLCLCHDCGGLVLVQKSEYHGEENDDHYTDYFPVDTVQEAERLNELYGGWAIEKEWNGKKVFVSNGHVTPYFR